MDLKIKDHIALVTGASRGLGAATAKLLSAEGVKVIINSRNAEKLEATAIRIRSKTGNPGFVSYN